MSTADASASVPSARSINGSANPDVASPSASPSNSAQPFSREVRLGLVLYGGVSLAIYMHGVCREFFRAVKGQGLYKLIKVLTDSDIVVDVVSGTSAGGINGIMLAYALTNGRDFKAAAELWRRDGDFGRMLRSPGQDTPPPQSLLNSEGYYQPRLEAAFREMPPYTPEAERGTDVQSDFRELDLFITGSEINGQVWTEFDDAGHPIDIKDHRAVFLLKHRQDRRQPFHPGRDPETTYQALAKLSRLTSCFPAAFAPVCLLNSKGDRLTSDNLIWDWGRLNKPSGEAYFLDGGILNTKPFTTTTKEIFYRLATRPVDRFLLYVEPDPEHFDAYARPVQPTFLGTILNSLISIPGYQSIADDLHLLAEHNTQVEKYRRLSRKLRDEIFTNVQAERKCYEGCATERVHKRARLVAICDRALKGVLKEDGQEVLMDPERAKEARQLVNAFDELTDKSATQEALRPPPAGMKKEGWKLQDEILRDFDVYFRLRRLFDLSYAIGERTSDPGITQAEFDQQRLLRYALNRQIELLQIIQTAMEEMVDKAPINWQKNVSSIKAGDSVNPEEVWKARAEAVWEAVELMFLKLLNAYQAPPAEERAAAPSALVSWVREYEATWKGVKWSNASLEFLTANWATRQHLSDLLEALRERSNFPNELSLGPGDQAQLKKEFLSLLSVTDDCERRMLATFSTLPFASRLATMYEEFELLDAHLYPLQLAGNLEGLDVIRTVRISPRDAQRGFSRKPLEEKVAGKSLAHFGGFLKRSWRSNDILWGRLDTVCQLTECLLKPERLREILRNPARLERIRRGFGLGAKQPTIPRDNHLHPANLFPHSHQEELTTRLQEFLLLSEDPKTLENALRILEDQPGAKGILTLAVEAEQIEILREELPRVIEDGITEQQEWNQFLVSQPDRDKQAGDQEEKAADRRPLFSAGAGDLSPLVVTAAAQEEASDLTRQMLADSTSPDTPAKTVAGEFFTERYRVGSERVQRDIPPLVLMEMFSTTLLVLRNCVFGSLGSGLTKRIQQNRVYTLGFDFPLRAFHSLVQFLRRASGWSRGIPIGLGVASALALLIAYLWGDQFIYGAHFRGTPLVCLVVLPLLVLVAEGVILWRGRVRRLGLWPILKDAAIAVAVLAPVASVVAALLLIFSTRDRTWAEHTLTLWLTNQHPTWLQWAARRAAILALFVVLPLVLPFLAGWCVTWMAEHRVAKPRELRQALNTYFSMSDLTLLAKRLATPWAVKQMANQVALEFCHGSPPSGTVEDLRKALRAAKTDSKIWITLDEFAASTQKLNENNFAKVLRRFNADEISEAAHLVRVKLELKNPEVTREVFADQIFREAVHAPSVWLCQSSIWLQLFRRGELFQLDRAMRAIIPHALS